MASELVQILGPNQKVVGRKFFSFSHFIVIVAIVAAVCTSLGQTPKEEAHRPISVFVDDPNTGLDPFFPNSPNRVRETETEGEKEDISQIRDIYSLLKLNAVIPNGARKFVTINKTHIQEGKTGKVETILGPVDVQVIKVSKGQAEVFAKGAQAPRILAAAKRPEPEKLKSRPGRNIP